MKYWAALFILPLFLTACDSEPIAEAEDEMTDTRCPSAPPADAVDYFPLAVGQAWTFDYDMGRLSARGSEREVGTLRWEVTEADACSAGYTVFSVRGTFEGVEQRRPPTSSGSNGWEDVGSVSRTSTLAFTLGDSLDLGPYSFGPIRRYYPPATEDTLSFRQDASRQNDAVCEGGPCFIRLTLVRGEGLILHRFHDEISPDTYGTGTMNKTN